MTLPPDELAALDRIGSTLTAEDAHLAAMYRVFGSLAAGEPVPDEDVVAPPRATAASSVSALRRAVKAARIAAIPAALLALLIMIVAIAAGGGRNCTSAAPLHRAAGTSGQDCPASRAAGLSSDRTPDSTGR
jgi:hypothetical protein